LAPDPRVPAGLPRMSHSANRPLSARGENRRRAAPYTRLSTVDTDRFSFFRVARILRRRAAYHRSFPHLYPSTVCEYGRWCDARHSRMPRLCSSVIDQSKINKVCTLSRVFLVSTSHAPGRYTGGNGVGFLCSSTPSHNSTTSRLAPQVLRPGILRSSRHALCVVEWRSTLGDSHANPTTHLL